MVSFLSNLSMLLTTCACEAIGDRVTGAYLPLGKNVTNPTWSHCYQAAKIATLSPKLLSCSPLTTHHASPPSKTPI
jgi:hypothetical protein